MKPAPTRPLCLAFWLALAMPMTSRAQTPPAPAPEPLAMPAAEVTPHTPVLESCRTLTDKAITADMKAVTAQSQKAELALLAPLFETAVSRWTQAAAQCDGRAKERAQRNLNDSQNIQASLSEQLGAGPQCTSAHKDAAALQDIARQALSERRWGDAAMLFRKAENMWDAASERCNGSQQEVANRRRDQSEIDGHNAEFCAPLFDKAREHTQKFRASVGGMTREDKLDASMVAETLWRDAAGQCKGTAAQDPARNNAQALARERGTPWVARAAPAPQPLVAAKISGPVIASEATMRQASGTGTDPVAAGALTTLLASGVQPTSPAVVGAIGEVSADNTRFSGQFVRDAGAATFTGTGKVVWASGDVFEGPMIKGQRHGKGLFVWANGQRYNGDWVNDTPTGQASVQFANGNQFEGSVLAGVPHGKGRMRYASGDSYSGQLKSGEPDGRGVYDWRNGQQFDGDWQAGRPNGQGKLKFATGNQFEGTVVNGVPNGQGALRFTSGDTYAGTFANGQPDGTGTFNWTTGDKYSGQWRAGKKHGQGTFTWKSGDLWTGVYENDEQSTQESSAKKN